MSSINRVRAIRMAAALAIILAILVPIMDDIAKKKASPPANPASSVAASATPESRSPDRRDMANLMSVMHGAVNQQLSMKQQRQFGENTTGLVLSLKDNFMQERT